ncbi:MAG TPA: insulinase family protein [Polyangiaceae bacterium]|nr:insulinase family protein [Polyangiaceae bacterium]
MSRKSPPARARFVLASALGAACALAAACGGSASPAAQPVGAGPGNARRPPRVAAAPPWTSPRLAHAQLDNGLELQLLQRHAAPLLELRLVVLSGTASDGEHPGVAALTAAALRPSAPGRAASREPLERAEQLGARWQLETTRDATTISVSLPRAGLAEGLALLGSFSVAPRLGDRELELLRRRELARVNQLLADDASWTASMALYAELFRASPRHHPYEHFDALPADLERASAGDCGAWYARNFSPRNARLVAVGDLNLEQLLPLAQRALGSWQGGQPDAPLFFTPPAPDRVHTLLVDHPGAASVELRLAMLGPERQDPAWAQLALLAELLDRNGAEALERLGEADRQLGARLEEVAHGATPLLLSARIALQQAPQALAALLETLSALAARPPEERALRAAAEQLSGRVLLGLESGAGAADLLSRAASAGLRESAFDEFRAELARIHPAQLHSAARRYLKAPPIVVMVGDAQRLVTPLRRFGQVHVSSAARNLQVERVLSQDPSAAGEAPAGP